ncbi:MAG: DpnD/PcfM family protein [Prevotellaceae bacterium]|nr:DpnD/PcfM family protein [Prevotellaceae bacterium]
MEYIFEIEETLATHVTVSAATEREAYMQVKRMYYDEEIVLTAENYVSTEIRLLDCN